MLGLPLTCSQNLLSVLMGRILRGPPDDWRGFGCNLTLRTWEKVSILVNLCQLDTVWSPGKKDLWKPVSISLAWEYVCRFIFLINDVVGEPNLLWVVPCRDRHLGLWKKISRWNHWAAVLTLWVTKHRKALGRDEEKKSSMHFPLCFLLLFLLELLPWLP